MGFISEERKQLEEKILSLEMNLGIEKTKTEELKEKYRHEQLALLDRIEVLQNNLNYFITKSRIEETSVLGPRERHLGDNQHLGNNNLLEEEEILLDDHSQIYTSL